MKKIVFVIIIAILYGALDVSAQKDYATVVYNNLTCKLPIPYTGFKTIPGDFKPDFDSLRPTDGMTYYYYLDVYDYNEYTEADEPEYKFEKFMSIGFKLDGKTKAWQINDFNSYMKSLSDSLNTDLTQIMDSVKSYYSIPKGKLLYSDLDKPKKLGCLYKMKDAFGIISAEYSVSEINPVKMMCVVNHVIFKRKICYAIMYCIYSSPEDIRWLKDASEAWAKRILELNK